MVVNADFATTRLGRPCSTVERGTVSEQSCAFVRRWNWPCGCAGELIGGALIELRCCEQHKR
jgi:hypothetical protein